MDLSYPDLHLHISVSAELNIHKQIRPIFLNATSVEDFSTVEQAAAQDIHPFYGIHPWYTEDRPFKDGRSYDELVRRVSDNKFCGIGECGLDFSQKYRHNRENQINSFESQLELAFEYNRPLSIHCVQAWGQLVSSLKRFTPLPAPFMLHSFYGPPEVLHQLLEMNAYISLSAMSLRNLTKSAPVIRKIPSDRILVESDIEVGSPDFSKISHFTILRNNYKTIAEIRSVSVSELISGVIENGKVFTN